MYLGVAAVSGRSRPPSSTPAPAVQKTSEINVQVTFTWIPVTEARALSDRFGPAGLGLSFTSACVWVLDEGLRDDDSTNVRVLSLKPEQNSGGQTAFRNTRTTARSRRRIWSLCLGENIYAVSHHLCLVGFKRSCPGSVLSLAAAASDPVTNHWKVPVRQQRCSCVFCLDLAVVLNLSSFVKNHTHPIIAAEHFSMWSGPVINLQKEPFWNMFAYRDLPC